MKIRTLAYSTHLIMVLNGALSHKLIWRIRILIIRTLMLGPNVSIIHRFHCITTDTGPSTEVTSEGHPQWQAAQRGRECVTN